MLQANNELLTLVMNQLKIQRLLEAKCLSRMGSNGFKWVHNISFLKQRLTVQTDEELENLGYHVDDYYNYNSPDGEFLAIKAKREWDQIMDDYWD